MTINYGKKIFNVPIQYLINVTESGTVAGEAVSATFQRNVLFNANVITDTATVLWNARSGSILPNAPSDLPTKGILADPTQSIVTAQIPNLGLEYTLQFYSLGQNGQIVFNLSQYIYNYVATITGPISGRRVSPIGLNVLVDPVIQSRTIVESMSSQTASLNAQVTSQYGLYLFCNPQYIERTINFGTIT